MHVFVCSEYTKFKHPPNAFLSIRLDPLGQVLAIFFCLFLVVIWAFLVQQMVTFFYRTNLCSMRKVRKKSLHGYVDYAQRHPCVFDDKLRRIYFSDRRRISLLILNKLQPSVAFLYPLKASEKPLGFLMFSGGIKKQHRAVMG